jgi:hypothetical protein
LDEQESGEHFPGVRAFHPRSRVAERSAVRLLEVHDRQAQFALRLAMLNRPHMANDGVQAWHSRHNSDRILARCREHIIRPMSRGPLTFRASDLTRAIKAATVAGMSIGRVEIDRDGTIVIVPGTPAMEEPQSDRPVNEWDDVS